MPTEEGGYIIKIAEIRKLLRKYPEYFSSDNNITDIDKIVSGKKILFCWEVWS